MTAKVGIGLPGLSVAETHEAAQAAADYEFDSFSVYGDLGDLPPFAVLHAGTDPLKNSPINRVGPMGIPVGLQHPEVIAMHAAALAEQLPGQAYLGLVRGAFLEQIGKKPASLADLQYSIEYIRETLEERGVDMPIYLGGFGPKLLTMAGQLGVDGVKLGGSANPALAARAKDTIGNPDVSVVLGAVSVIDPDRRAARKLARHEVAKYLRIVGTFDVTLGPDETESLDTFIRRFDNDDPQASDAISDSLLDKFALAGSPDDALELLSTMGEDVDCFELGTPHGLGKRSDAIHYIGKSVLNELGGRHEV